MTTPKVRPPLNVRSAERARHRRLEKERMTPEEWAAKKAHEAQRGREWRANRTPEQIEKTRAGDRERRRNGRKTSELDQWLS